MRILVSYRCLKFILLNIILILLNVLPIAAQSAALEISPIHLYLSQNNPIDAFTLRNKSDQSTLLQLSSVAWLQAAGKDIYHPTRDIIINPPIFSLAPHAEQVIRIGLRNGWQNSAQEMSYRLYIQEVPKKTKSDSVNLQTVLRLSLPIFLTPAEVKSDLHWQAEKMPNGSLKLILTNQGNIHIQLSHLKISAKGTKNAVVNQTVFAYILPFQKYTWTFKLPRSILDSHTVVINADSNRGKIISDVSLSL